MSWDSFIETQLLPSGVITTAAILANTNAEAYAVHGDFSLTSYNIKEEVYEGREVKEKDVTIYEAEDLVAFARDRKLAGGKQSIRMCGAKWVYVRDGDLEGSIILKTSGGGGACIALSDTLIIVGIHAKPSPSQNEREMSLGTIRAVEALAEYLRSISF